MASIVVPSPIGALSVTERAGAIVALSWDSPPDAGDSPLLREAARQLSAYFAGTLTRFDLPLALAGSDFRQRVWDAMREIPYGETATYGDLARRTGGTARAVGGACGANPIPVIVPCHRVVARNGSGGYSGKGGLRTKAALLDIESRKTRLL